MSRLVAEDDPLAGNDALAIEESESDEEAVQQLGEDVDDYEDETSTQSGSDNLSWIAWYCSLPGHEYFAEVSEDFIEDDFNLTGLNVLVPFYKEALDMVLDVEPEEESLKIPDVSIVESSAELLYGLIHQRFIITRQGLQQMVSKYEAAHFGVCPRVFCSGTRVLPCGRSDLPGVDTVKLFCPSCIDTYTPPSSRFAAVDGSFFGTTFPHLLFQTYKELLPTVATGATSTPSPAAHNSSSRASSIASVPGADQEGAGTTRIASGQHVALANKIYVPRIYGFKVSERARSGPRMQWLRSRPKDEREMQKVDFFGRWKQTGSSSEQEDQAGDSGNGDAEEAGQAQKVDTSANS